MAAETESLKAGKLHKLSTGKWFVHCKWCETETQLEARNEEEAYAMLAEWRLSMPRAKYADRTWSCPECVDSYWKDRISSDWIQLDRRRRRQLHHRTSLPTHPTQQQLRSML